MSWWPLLMLALPQSVADGPPLIPLGESATIARPYGVTPIACETIL